MSRSGLYLSDDDTDPVQRGVVVSAGDTENIRELKPGDVAVFKRNATWEVEIEGESLIWVRDEHVLLKLEI